MKSTDQFKTIIQNHLNGLAAKDPLFAATLKKPKKNINDCVTYILNTVQKSGCNGFADDEIFGMAVHYYDEDNVQPVKPINGNVVVNHGTKKKAQPFVQLPAVELTDEEKKLAKQQAIDSIIQEEKDKLKNKQAKKQDQKPQEASLFD